VYRLSAKSAPPEVVNDVLARAASGERVSDAEGNRMFREFKNRNRKETQSKGRRGQAKNEIARANAQAIMKRFARDGAVFLLGIRDDIRETLTFLEQELGVSAGPNQRAGLTRPLLPTAPRSLDTGGAPQVGNSTMTASIFTDQKRRPKWTPR
jgi:hypothetical protein